jgi:hypothetical protein
MLETLSKAVGSYLVWVGLIGLVMIQMPRSSAAAAKDATVQDAEALVLGKASMSLRASVADLKQA